MSRASTTKLQCAYCGDLAWTVKEYGKVAHKESCPHRPDPWSQGFPYRTEWPDYDWRRPHA